MTYYFSLILLLFSITVTAADNAQYLLQQSTYKGLTEAQNLMGNERYSEAEISLKQLLSQTKVTSYDRAVVDQTLGYLYSSIEQYKKAAQHFEQALDSQALPEQVDHDLRFNLAQILIMQEHYKQGIALLTVWIEKEPSPSADAHVLIANAYYQLANYRSAGRHLKQAIDQAETPQEVWYQLLMAIHFELKQYKSAIQVLEILISDYPYNKLYWSQLSALYMQQNKQSSALAVSALMQRLELEDSRVLLNVADLYRYIQVPYKSAQILIYGFEQGVIAKDKKNLQRLADSWLAAREIDKAAVILEQLAQMDDSGVADVQYARVLFEMEQWRKALPVIKHSLKELKDKKRKGQATLLLAKSYFELEEFDKSRQFFDNALRYSAQRQQAQFWLDYLAQLE